MLEPIETNSSRLDQNIKTGFLTMVSRWSRCMMAQFASGVERLCSSSRFGALAGTESFVRYDVVFIKSIILMLIVLDTRRKSERKKERNWRGSDSNIQWCSNHSRLHGTKQNILQRYKTVSFTEAIVGSVK